MTLGDIVWIKKKIWTTVPVRQDFYSMLKYDGPWGSQSSFNIHSPVLIFAQSSFNFHSPVLIFAQSSFNFHSPVLIFAQFSFNIHSPVLIFTVQF